MKKTFYWLLLATITSCQTAGTERLDDLEWILGTWTGIDGSDKVVEQWQKSSDTLFTGWSWFISNSDTVASEQLQIVARVDDIVYVAEPSGQQKTEFKLTQMNNNEAMFENPAHDFPQRIYYRKINSDSLYAKIEGEINGTNRSMEFYWSKEK